MSVALIVIAAGTRAGESLQAFAWRPMKLPLPAASDSTCSVYARRVRDVAEIQLTRVKAHLVLEPELSLIDCGYVGSRGRIARAIAAQGRMIEHLVRVVITHGHPDHAGTAREIAEAGVPILIHPADGARLRTTWRDAIRRPSRGRVFSAMTPELPEVVPIEDGDVLPMLGGLQVVHTPGTRRGASACMAPGTASCSLATRCSGGSGEYRLRARCTATTTQQPSVRCNDSRTWTSKRLSSVTSPR